MSNSSRGTDSFELTLQGRHLFFLFVGSAIVLFLVFAAGLTLGRHSISSSMPATIQNTDEKQLDCLDWLEKQTDRKVESSS